MHDAEGRTNWETRLTPYCTCRYAPCTYPYCVLYIWTTAVVGLEAPLHHKAHRKRSLRIVTALLGTLAPTTMLEFLFVLDLSMHLGT